MALAFLSPIHRATRQVSVHLEARIAPLGVSAGEGHLLTYLRSYGPCAITQLHRVFGFKRSTLTSMFDRLEENGLVVRELDPEDRRSFLVALTREGRRVADRIQAVLEEFEGAIRARVRRADVDGFGAVLAAIGDVAAVEIRPGSRS